MPEPALAVIGALENAGFEAWLVGGFVRDALRGVEPNDIDIATNAHWQQTRDACTAAGMAVHETGTKHGTVTVVYQHIPIEVTTFRTEGTYSDNRHPDFVHFVDSIEEDLARRDFTINAMAFHPSRGLVDPFDGQMDLAHHIVRCVHDPAKRFKEDALRVLRALRFASQLGFWLAPDTEVAVRKYAKNMSSVAGERLRVEMEKFLCGTNVRKTLMRFPDELAVVVPCIERMKGFDQHNPHHVYDVLEHTAYVIDNTPAYPLVRWAALFHDSGKPDTFFIGDDNIGHMPNHPIESVNHLRASAKTLHFSRKELHDLELLVRYHDERPRDCSKKDVRHLYAKVENDNRLFHTMCDLMRGDAMGKAEFNFARVQQLDEFEQLYNDMVANGEPLSIDDLPITGGDIVELGIEEGPRVGLILSELFNAVANETIPDTREALMKSVQKFVEKQKA